MRQYGRYVPIFQKGCTADKIIIGIRLQRNMNAKVLSIYEEGSLVGTKLIGAKGFALLVDVDGEKTLFDTGRKSGYLIQNLSQLGIEFDSIDRIVLSHGHRDHTGGLNGFLEELENPIKIYSKKECWEPRADSLKGIRLKNTGTFEIQEHNKEKAIMETVDGMTELSENLFILPLPAGDPDGRHMKYENGSWKDDDFSDEIALVLKTKGGPVLMTGCAHSGLIPALDAVRTATGKNAMAVVGGVHTVKKKKAEIEALAVAVSNEKVVPQLYLSHCSTPDSKTLMRVKLGLTGVKEFYVGTELIFE